MENKKRKPGRPPGSGKKLKKKTGAHPGIKKRNTNGFLQNPSAINRKGRPPSIVTELKKLLSEPGDIEVVISKRDPDDKRRLLKEKITLLTDKPLCTVLSVILLEKALSGDMNAIRLVLEYVIGKPLQIVAPETDNIQIPITHFIQTNAEDVPEELKDDIYG